MHNCPRALPHDESCETLYSECAEEFKNIHDTIEFERTNFGRGLPSTCLNAISRNTSWAQVGPFEMALIPRKEVGCGT